MDSLHQQINAVCNYSTGCRTCSGRRARAALPSEVLPRSPPHLRVGLGHRIAPTRLSTKPRQGRGSHPAARSSPPSRPALPDGFCGGPLCCPSLPPPRRPSTPPTLRVLQGCWEAVSEQRALLNLAEGGRENAGRGHIAGPASPPLALPDPCGCWGPPTPALAERAMSLGSN